MRLLLLLVVLSACPAAQFPHGPPLVLESSGDGAFSVGREGAGLGSLRASVTISGTEVKLDAPTITRDGGETTLEQVIGSTRLRLTLRAQPDFVTARLAAFCEGPCTGRVEGFTLTGDLLTTASEPVAVLANGYSSWAPSYYATVQRSAEPTAEVELTGNNDNHLTTDARLSWWVSGLVLRNDASVVAGALTAQTWKTKVLTWRGDTVKVRQTSCGAVS